MAQVVRVRALFFLRQPLHLLSLGLQPPTFTITATSTTAHHLCLRRNAHLRPPRALRPPRELDLSIDERRTKNVRIESDDGISEDDDDDKEKKKRKSRNEMKREARQSVRWAMDLASFSTPQIKRILKTASLEEDIFEAIMLVKRLGSDVREGKRRQYNYIGRLLRDADAQPDLLGALIQATKDGDHSRLQALAGSMTLVDEGPEEEFHESESESEPEQEHEDKGDHVLLASKWFDGLIIKDIQTSNEIYSLDSMDFDRQELRKLVRKVHTLQDRQNNTEETLEKSTELAAAKKSLNRFLCLLAKRHSSAQNIVV